jgi:bacterioferritin
MKTKRLMTASGGNVMKEESIQLLNKAVADELSAIHQYMYFHFRLDDLGYAPLATLLRNTAIEEMGHVERLAERVLFLRGEVEMVVGEEVTKIHEPKAMLDRAKQMEQHSAECYNRWALECSQNADSVSKRLFEDLVADEERHFDAFDQQVDHIDRFGERYLALQSFQSDPAAPEEA